MTDAVRDAIAAAIAELERVTEVPSGPFGYGTDISCAGDLTETMEEVDGFSTLALAQALVRRLDCARGQLPDDPDYGIDVRSYCNRGATTQDIRSLASRIRGEVTKDDRVDTATVTVTPSSTGDELGVKVAVTPYDARLGPFTLTLAVTSAAVLIEELRG